MFHENSEKEKKTPGLRKEETQDVLELVNDAETDPRMRARLAASHRAGEMVKGYRTFKEVGRVFKEERGAKDVELKALHSKKEGIENARAQLSKRYEGFKKANENSEKLLAPFGGERRELLLESLDRDFNPVGYASKEENEGKTPRVKNKRREEKITKVREDFDKRIGEYYADSKDDDASAQRRKASSAAYLFLKEERVYKAEDELNGAISRDVNVKLEVRTAVHELQDLMATHPALTNSLLGVAKDVRLSEVQRLYGLKIVFDEFAVRPDYAPVINQYMKASEQFTASSFTPEVQRHLEKQIAEARESFKNAQERFSGERALESHNL